MPTPGFSSYPPSMASSPSSDPTAASTRSLSQRLAGLDPHALSPELAAIAASLTSAGGAIADEVADLLPCALQQALGLAPLRQSHHLERDRIHTVTYVLLPGVDPAALEAALVDREWSWWKSGKTTLWTRRDDGGCRFVLAPAAPLLPSKVGIDLAPRRTGVLPTPWGASVPLVNYPARFFADFEGPGRYEILTIAGGCALRSVWDGVARLGIRKLLPLHLILHLHLGAEAGTLSFPLPKGTGFPGLVRHLTP